MNLLFINTFIALGYVGIRGQFTLFGFLVGFGLGYLALWLTQPLYGRSRYFQRVPKTAQLAGYFLVELLLSNLRVTWDVITPGQISRPGIVGVPLSASTELEILLVANMITRAGADRVLTMDLHAAQIQGFFDIPVDHLYAAPILIEAIRRKNLEKPVIVSPDAGGVERARAFAKRLGADLAIIDKRRTAPNVAKAMAVIGMSIGFSFMVALVANLFSAFSGGGAGLVQLRDKRGKLGESLAALRAIRAALAPSRIFRIRSDHVSIQSHAVRQGTLRGGSGPVSGAQGSRDRRTRRGRLGPRGRSGLRTRVGHAHGRHRDQDGDPRQGPRQPGNHPTGPPFLEAGFACS